MLLTKASEYALIALIFIAKSKIPQGVNTLSSELGISKSFLAKILQSLAKAEILVSFKGAKGGFCLARDPSDISILEVIQSCDETSGLVFTCSSGDRRCPNLANKEQTCHIWPLLNTIQDKVDDLMQQTKLSDLIK